MFTFVHMAQLELHSGLGDSTASAPYVFVDVAVPRAVEMLFTYRVPGHMLALAKVGMRVVVPLGKKALITGIIRRVHNQNPKTPVKDVLQFPDPEPTVIDKQLALHDWVAQYYLSSVGEVTQAALPAGLKISTESRVQLYPGLPEEEIDSLPEPERSMVLLVQQEENCKLEALTELAGGVKQLATILKDLQARQILVVYELAKDKYSPKVERRVRLNQDLLMTELGLDLAADMLNRSPAQYQVLTTYLKAVDIWATPELNQQGVAASWLLQESQASDAALRALVKRGIFVVWEQMIPRYRLGPVEEPYQPTLSPEQERAKQEIITAWSQGKPVLLHGITGSGKTEVYISLMQEALQAGQQVLFLLPEIALTSQMVQRLHKAFGQQMGVYHSKFSDNERLEVWHQLQAGHLQVVVGVRSAVFLPFNNLGLVIIDEEHDSSYKQHNPSPRYHGRDTALVLARLHHAQVLMGSATPAVESYYKAQTGKWALVTLSERYGYATLPSFRMVDLRAEREAKTMFGAFSSELLTAVDGQKEAGKQALLFQNRRGYAPQVVCQECAAVPECPHCDVALTYHLHKNEMRCHYCGHKQAVPQKCPKCGASHLKTEGYGTEQLEEQLVSLRPDMRIRRMDQDSTRSKNAFASLVNELETGQVDVLVGTQMISKGFDFKQVGLVGVFDIDRFMHQPHYRSREAAFQMLTQVAGRAGRHGTDGKVLIQTVNPHQPLLAIIANHDYQLLYDTELVERGRFMYPPFCRLIEVIIRHQDPLKTTQVAQTLALDLRQLLGQDWVLGPSDPQVARVRNLYHKQLLLKLDLRTPNHPTLKAEIRRRIRSFLADAPNKAVEISINVDPLP